MSFSVVWTQQGAIKRFCGHLPSEEFLSAHHQITESDRLDSTLRYVITDFTEVQSESVDDDALEKYGFERCGVARYLPNVRGALVANTPITLGLCERIMSPKYRTPYEMRVFHTLEEAKHWLMA